MQTSNYFIDDDLTFCFSSQAHLEHPAQSSPGAFSMLIREPKPQSDSGTCPDTLVFCSLKYRKLVIPDHSTGIVPANFVFSNFKSRKLTRLASSVGNVPSKSELLPKDKLEASRVSSPNSVGRDPTRSLLSSAKVANEVKLPMAAVNSPLNRLNWALTLRRVSSWLCIKSMTLPSTKLFRMTRSRSFPVANWSVMVPDN
jgi:hypothetical protein